MWNIFRKKDSSKKKRIYLDNAGATEVSERAKRALVESLSLYGNPSAIHYEGTKAGQLLDSARAMCATILNAHAYEIYFVSSGTESCNLAVVGTYNAYHKNNPSTVPHMIVSTIEHPAILEPIKALEREGKIQVTYIPVTPEGFVKVEDIKQALTDATILVSVMYANNEIGTLQPVKEIGRILDEWKKSKSLSHAAYPYFHTDACQAANYCNLDVLRLKCHLMTVNSSKIYGPKGAALLYKREGVKLIPVTLGGGQERELRSGTEATPLYYSFAHALRETKELEAQEVKRLESLNDYMRKELIKAVPSIIFYGAFDEVGMLMEGHKEPKRVMKRLPNNINCRAKGITSEEMILRLDALGFAVSHKSACASLETDGSYVVMALGATEQEALENIRISFGRRTTKDDIDAFVSALKSIVGKYVSVVK